jgi:DNA-binding response OmpR family regulator
MCSKPPLRLIGCRQVWQNGGDNLSYKEFDLLACLCTTRVRFHAIYWNAYGSASSARTARSTYIRWLREKLEYDPANPVLIHTVRAARYRFQDPALAVQRQQHEEV